MHTRAGTWLHVRRDAGVKRGAAATKRCRQGKSETCMKGKGMQGAPRLQAGIRRRQQTAKGGFVQRAAVFMHAGVSQRMGRRCGGVYSFLARGVCRQGAAFTPGRRPQPPAQLAASSSDSMASSSALPVGGASSRCTKSSAGEGAGREEGAVGGGGAAGAGHAPSQAAHNTQLRLGAHGAGGRRRRGRMRGRGSRWRSAPPLEWWELRPPCVRWWSSAALPSRSAS